MTTRDRRYLDNRLAKGWKRITVMLEPDDAARLDRLSERHGGRWNAIRFAIRQAQPNKEAEQ